MNNELWQSVKEGVEALGNMLLEAFDRVASAVQAKGGELFKGLGGSISEGFRSAKTGLSNSIAPNAIGKSKTAPSPSQAIEKTPTRAPEVSPSRENYGDMLKSAGFSMESVGAVNVQASSDLGNASVGMEGVGCASYDAPRAFATQTQVIER